MNRPFLTQNRPTRRSIYRIVKLLAVLVLLFTSACLGDVSPNETPPAATPTPYPEAMLTFRVTLPVQLNPGEGLYLNILDEVTGLALNPHSYVMQAEDGQHYSVILPFPIGSVLKYRYTRQGAMIAQEHVSDGRPVRYRLYHVDGPAVVQDLVSRWSDTAFAGPTGRIQGQVLDGQTNLPIPNILVEAGGVQALTTSDGSFLLEGLPPGTHQLVAYALDGAYATYQQGATVADNSTTPAPLHLVPAPLVKVAFIVRPPAGTPANVPLRFAGNLLQLGNTFADLSGGVSTVASRMPLMTPLGDGRSMLTLVLPVGADLQYKYTLGDGLWSAEHRATGEFNTRRLIVPATGGVIEDQVETWNSGSAPITFEVTAPPNTPQDEVISIQFSLGFGWMEPIPMGALGDNRWIFVLTSPLDLVGEFRYRYCREDQCNSADDASTAGNDSNGYPVSTSGLAQEIVDDIKGWAWLPQLPPATVPGVQIIPRGPGFIAGVEFLPSYHPTWSTRWPKAVSSVTVLGANYLFLSPTWTITRDAPPVLESLVGSDALWQEQANLIIQARNQGLQVGLFPRIHTPVEADIWWQKAPRDFAWWVGWFERYRAFILHHADLAARTGAQVLIMGGEDVTPALPNGVLSDGSPSGIPADMEKRWRDLIGEVRARFNGTLLWALPYPDGIRTPPPFLDDFDQIYVLWSAKLASQPLASEAELYAEAARLLDADLQPIQTRYGRPVLLGLSYPSATGGLTGCVPGPQGECLNFDVLSRPKPDVIAVEINLSDQAEAYNALLQAVNERSWISGLVSRGYYPPVPLLDKSVSVHGKPASGVLWYWFPRLLGKQ